MAEHALYEQVHYKSTSCATCGILIFMPSAMLDARRNNGEPVYCVNGHVGAWTETEAMRLQKALDAEKRRVQMVLNDTANETKMRREAEAKLGRLEKRVRNGVCPCCKRSFMNLRRHMETKHPGGGDGEAMSPRRKARMKEGGKS